jgi:ribosomal protein S18 acetylase RimI-like enzyme
MKIRKAEIEDYDTIKEIKLLSKVEELKYSETLKPLSETRERYLSYLRGDLTHKNRSVYIAEDGGRVVGIVLAKIIKPLLISKFKIKGYVSNLYVIDDYRRKGVAERLAKSAFKWLKDLGVSNVSLEIHIKNIPALNLYHKLGFNNYTIKMVKNI